MNLEHLCRSVLENLHRLKNKKKVFTYVKYQFELLAWKRQKLKLGAIVFEFKDIVYGGIVLAQTIEMRYIRQDTSQEDDLKIENRLKAIGWKWDFKNIGAFIIVFTVGLMFLYANLYVWYCESFPAIAFRNPQFDVLIHFSLDIVFILSNVGYFKDKANYDLWLTEALTDFCSFYDMLF